MILNASKILSVLVVILILFVGFWFRSGVFQEPLRTMVVALRLETSAASMLFVNENDFVVHAHDIEAVLDVFRQHDWDQVERFGSAILLERQNERAGFGCRMYSSRYLVCSKFDQKMAPVEVDNNDNKNGSQMSTLPFGTYNFPGEGATQQQALVRGTIIFEAGCLYLISGDQRYTPLFPAQITRYLPAHQVLLVLGHSIQHGTMIETNGGYVLASNMAEMPLVDPVPNACVSEEVVMIGTEAWR